MMTSQEKSLYITSAINIQIYFLFKAVKHKVIQTLVILKQAEQSSRKGLYQHLNRHPSGVCTNTPLCSLTVDFTQFPLGLFHQHTHGILKLPGLLDDEGPG